MLTFFSFATFPIDMYWLMADLISERFVKKMGKLADAKPSISDLRLPDGLFAFAQRQTAG